MEEVLDFGRQYQFGLEAGSKPELLAVVALASNETPIICNGFKDAEFIEMAMLAQKIGRVVEGEGTSERRWTRCWQHVGPWVHPTRSRRYHRLRLQL